MLVVPFRRGFLTFARLHDLEEHFGIYLPLKLEGECPLDYFLQSGWSTLGIERWDARNRFSDLARQALEASLRARGLRDYAMSERQTAWWSPTDIAPTTKVPF